METSDKKIFKKNISMTSVATEAWIGCALLQRDNPQGAFSPKQIKEKVNFEMQNGRLTPPLRPGVYQHAISHNVANKKAQPVRLRLLTATISKKRRLFRPDDPVHSSRQNTPGINEKDDIPADYNDLIDWYNNVFLNLENVAEAAPLDDIGTNNQPNLQQKSQSQKRRGEFLFPSPTANDLKKAREAFVKHEPRDLFYRTSMELVELSIQKKISLSLAEAIAVLLQTWNMIFYRFRKFDNQHFKDIENLINTNHDILTACRSRSLDTFVKKDESTILVLFDKFEKVLGPVGASKSLHLLAPHFFPLWDREIAKSYKLSLQKNNAMKYITFMKITLKQCEKIVGKHDASRNILKSLDEYNYCKFTKKWI